MKWLLSNFPRKITTNLRIGRPPVVPFHVGGRLLGHDGLAESGISALEPGIATNGRVLIRDCRRSRENTEKG